MKSFFGDIGTYFFWSDILSTSASSIMIMRWSGIQQLRCTLLGLEQGLLYDE